MFNPFKSTKTANKVKGYESQTKIGKWFGISAIEVGKLLSGLGLKEKGKPTPKAFQEGFVSTKNDNLWNVEKTKKILATKIDLLPEDEYWTYRMVDIILATENIMQEDDKMGFFLYLNRYNEIPAKIAEKIKYRAEFEIALCRCEGDIGQAMMNVMGPKMTYHPPIGTEETKLFKRMIKRYYPDYLDKLNTIVVFG